MMVRLMFAHVLTQQLDTFANHVVPQPMTCWPGPGT